MDRRKALRTIGFGTTAITVTPAVVGMLQSCQTQTESYLPIHFSKDQFSVLSQLMDLIIPKTEIPGAVELKLPEFLDGFINVVFNQKTQQKMTSGLDHFIALVLKDSGKSSAARLKVPDYHTQLAKYLKADKQQNSAQDDENYQTASAFAKQLRSMTINAFKTNEYIGENVMAYAPIPGEQKGCVDLMENTGGKAWSSL